jgi:hypothetical protein
MKILTSAALVGALALPCALQAQATFEGKVVMKMSPSNGKSASLNMSIKDGNVRTDVQTEKGTASMIMDFKNQQMIMLIPQMQKYIIQPMGGQGAQPGAYPAGSMPHSASNAEGGSFTDTGETATICGYPCKRYLAKTSKDTADIWVTDQLGTFAGFFHGGGPGGRGASMPSGGWESMIKGKAFFPMRIVSHSQKGTDTIEVTSVDKTSLPDSLFQPPAGWEKFDMGGMMGGMMPGGYGGRPPGSN